MARATGWTLRPEGFRRGLLRTPIPPRRKAEFMRADGSVNLAAVGDWIARGSACPYALTPDQVHARLAGPTIEATRPRFERVFREYGLPERIRTDNGAPFASNALGRLSQLSVWFVRLGIRSEFIEPGKPQHNARHENMHGTSKKHTARPPQHSFPAQQHCFDTFRRESNTVRPHEALHGAVPTDRYQPSPRPSPRALEPLTYPGQFKVRYLSRNGGIRWNTRWVCVSHLLMEQHVRLEAIDDGLWDVHLGPIWLGWFVEPRNRIVDPNDRELRRPLTQRRPQMPQDQLSYLRGQRGTFPFTLHPNYPEVLPTSL